MTPHPATAQPGTSRTIARPPARRRRGALSLLATLLAATLFATPLHASAPSQAPTNLEVLVADFNHDGIPDVLIPSSTSPTATIAFGTLPFGTFSPATKAVTTPSACVVPSQGSVPSQGAVAFGSVVAADFNGDGFPDLFFVCGTSTSGETTISGVMLGNGDGTFATPILLNAPFANSGVAGDFNRDGKMDLVLVSYPNGYSGSGIQSPALLFFAGNGDGTFAAPITSPLGTSATFQPGQFVFSSPVAADVDGDGYPDIVLNSAYGYAPTDFNGATLSISVFGNKQNGSFGVLTSGTRLPDVTAAAGTYPASNDLKLLPGNFFGDAHPAFAVPDSGTNAGIFLIRNTSTPGSFSLGTATKSTYASLQNAAAATFTGSGYTDLLVSNGTSLNALINDGAGNFGGSGSNPVVFSSLSFPTTNNLFAIADANGDGYSDLYTASLNSGSLALAVNLVSGSATATTAPFSLPVGNTEITANWSGNINYSAASANGTQTVTLTPTTFNLSSSPNPSTGGGSVTFTGTVISSVTTGSVPSGVYKILDGSTQIATGTLDENSGGFTFTTSALTLGTHAIQAVYAGDSFFATSSSTTLSQIVNSGASNLTWNPGPITAGTPLSSAQLNSVATDANGNSIPGVYVYNPPAGTVLSAGSQVLNVTFTPTDQTSYSVASLSTTIVVLPANQTALTTNLLLNPGAELGLVDGAIPNWTPSGEGSPTVDTGTFNGGINPHSGTYDFLGQNGPGDSLSQTVSLLTQGITASQLDSGTVAASLSFWEQGLSQGTPSDDASITLAFLDASSNTISTITTAEVDSHNGVWQNFSGSYPVPTGTRSIRYTMNFIRHSGSDLDGYIDDNSLILATIPTAAQTATTLAITSGATPVTTVPSGSAITLTATVLSGTAPVAPGQINFCDAAAPRCTDIHLLGTAQLTSAGTATLKFIPGIGTHTYKAVFLGTPAALATASAASNLTVTGILQTSTTVIASGNAGNYSLTATTIGVGGSAAVPTGQMAFVDTTDANRTLATAALISQGSGLRINSSSVSLAGGGASGIAAADFNGDGKTDLAIPDGSNNTVRILINSGPGTFTAASSVALSSLPVFIATGDFNGDGKADLVVTNGAQGANAVTVLLGDGTGSFSPLSSTPAGTHPQYIVVGDFNGDGIQDLVVSNQDVNTMTVLLGNGDGTFTQGATIPTGNSPYATAAADFNGDGKPDLAITDVSSNNLTILLGNGDGTFAAAASPAVGSTPGGIVAADFNGDGKVDLAVSNTADNNVTILIGNGDGTFIFSGNAATGQYPQPMALGDFNGDGNVDIAVANYTGSTVTYLLGRGNGVFLPSAAPSSSGQPLSLVAGDFDGDGQLDLITANLGSTTSSTTSNQLTVFLNQPTQTVTATATSISPVGTGTHQVIASYPGDTLYAPSASTPVALTAQQIPTILTWPTPAAIRFGNPLSAAQLNASAATSTGAAIPGTFNYTPTAGTVLPVGIQTLSVLFTPTSPNYATAALTQTITITRAIPTLVWPTPAAITYGNRLSAQQLNATASGVTGAALPGTFTYTPAAGAVLTAGVQTLSVLFTPTDATNYAPTTATQLITVNRGVPTVVWVTPAPITFGTPLSSTQLNAAAFDTTGAALPGVFTYTPAAGTILSAGSQTLNVTFTPTDTLNYTTGSAAAIIVVQKVTSSLTWSNPAAISYGTALSSAQLNAAATTPTGATIPGTFAYTPAAGTILSVGTQTLSVLFTPTDANYTTATTSVTITVQQATPTLNWTPAAVTIAYGTPLGPQQLNATATTPTGVTIPGTFSYSPATGTVLPVGTQTLRVLFTPAGSNYITASATQSINVTQATPTLVWPTPAAIAQGTALSATQLNATATGINGATLPGVFTYTPAAGTVPAAGTQTLSVLFTPTDTLNYITATATVRLTVTGLSLTAITPNTAKLADPATTITLNGTGFTTGSLAQVNGTRIATTYINPTTLTAIIPATNLAAVGTLAITVANPATSTVTSSLPFTVAAPTPSIILTGPTTTQPGSQPALALTIANPYPIPLTATFTLGFTSSVTPAVDDPSIQFAGGGRTFTFTVPANSTTVPAIQLQAGTVAGTITIPLTLTAAGVNVTPTTIQPVTIVVPGSVPAVTTATITRSTASFTVTIHGFSNTREVTTATFHFVPATGAQIDTPDFTVPVSTIFSGWFTSAPSVPYGSTFTYTQVFNVSDTAANIGSVQVTLTNAVGVSTTYTAQ